jgi:hypothetical protein
MAMRRRHWIFLLAFAVYVVSIVILARFESGLPPHTDLQLAGGLPATLYLPVLEIVLLDQSTGVTNPTAARDTHPRLRGGSPEDEFAGKAYCAQWLCGFGD